MKKNENGEIKIDKVDEMVEGILKGKSYLNQVRPGTSIVFVDICDSTMMKNREQEKWLPVFTRFFNESAKIIERHCGTVIKLIGDEVMAVFTNEENGNMSSAQHCLSAVEELMSRYNGLGKDGIAIKIAADFGAPAFFSGEGIPLDVLGTCIDRCARIKTYLNKNQVIASEYFVEALHGRRDSGDVRKPRKSRDWKDIGAVGMKGIKEKVRLFQYQRFGELLSKSAVREREKSTTSSEKTIRTLKAENEKLVDKLQYLQQRFDEQKSRSSGRLSR